MFGDKYSLQQIKEASYYGASDIELSKAAKYCFDYVYKMTAHLTSTSKYTNTMWDAAYHNYVHNFKLFM